MTHYTNIKMRITEGQKDKIKKAFESNSKSITIRFICSDLHGEDVIALTKSQVDSIWRKERFYKKNVKNAISSERKNRRWIFTSVSCIDSIPNGNCLASFRSWSFIRTGEYGSSKTNWKRFASQEGVVCVRLKHMGNGCTLDQPEVKDFKMLETVFTW